LRGGAKAAQARHRVADHPQGRRHRHRPAWSARRWRSKGSISRCTANCPLRDTV